MTYNPAIHHRRSVRLSGYDYRQAGAYFVTVCSFQKLAIFCAIIDGIIHPSCIGQIIVDVWHEMPNMYPHVKCGPFMLMPNHIHAIIEIDAVHQGAVQQGAVQQGAVQQGAVQQGAVQQGAIQQGAIQQGAVQQGAINCAPTLGQIVRAFKAKCSWKCAKSDMKLIHPLWQRNYYEHIIRDQESYEKIAYYITTNPLRWVEDKYYA